MKLNIYCFLILLISMSLQIYAKDIFYEIKWEEIENATKYEIEILDDKQNLLQKEITSTESFIWKYNKKGKFYFRFKYFIDDQESEFSDPRLILLKGKYKVPKSIKVYSPFDQHKYVIPEDRKSLKVFFHFKKVPNIKFYRLFIADDPAKLTRRNAMFSLDLHNPKVNLSLAEGEYHWRVYAVHYEGVLKSEVRKLNIIQKERKIAAQLESDVTEEVEKRKIDFGKSINLFAGNTSMQYAFEKDSYDYSSNDNSSILTLGIEGQAQMGTILVRSRYYLSQQEAETTYTESNFNLDLIPFLFSTKNWLFGFGLGYNYFTLNLKVDNEFDHDGDYQVMFLENVANYKMTKHSSFNFSLGLGNHINNSYTLSKNRVRAEYIYSLNPEAETSYHLSPYLNYQSLSLREGSSDVKTNNYSIGLNIGVEF